jgi:hypothetical protein
MAYQEPYSRLMKRTDKKKLFSKVMVYVPANHIAVEKFFDPESDPIRLEYQIRQNGESPAGYTSIPKEFDWNGTACDVSTQIFDSSGTPGGKNVIHTSGADTY